MWLIRPGRGAPPYVNQKDEKKLDMQGIREYPRWKMGFPGASDSKESAGIAGDPGSIPESERSPGEGNGNPLQYSYLENFMDRGAWRATVPGVTKELDTTELVNTQKVENSNCSLREGEMDTSKELSSQ